MKQASENGSRYATESIWCVRRAWQIGARSRCRRPLGRLKFRGRAVVAILHVVQARRGRRGYRGRTNLPEAVHFGLRVQVGRNGRSMAAEDHAILAAAACPHTRGVGMGDAIVRLGSNAGITGRDIATTEGMRDQAPAKPLQLQ